MANPNAATVAANASAMHLDSRTPGLNIVIEAWAALQDFTGPWAVNQYNALTNYANLIAGLQA